MNISENLKKFRQDHKLSQAEMAIRLGLKNQQAYSYYEKLGDRFDFATAKEFGEKLGVNLLTENGDVEVKVTLASVAKSVVEMHALMKTILTANAELLANQSGRTASLEMERLEEVYISNLKTIAGLE